MITGHGIATTDDEWRESILQETVDILVDAAADGIPIDDTTWERICERGRRLGLDVDAWQASARRD